MEESVMETITKMSELDDKNYFTIARVIENGKCVELHYNNGKASIEYGIKDEDNNWNDEVDTDLKWFRLNLTDDEILEILDKKFNEYFPKSAEEKLEKKIYTKDEIRITKLSILTELKQNIEHNILCYSTNYLMTQPKEEYVNEWKIENKKLLLVEEMIREEKQKSKDKNKDKSL